MRNRHTLVVNGRHCPAHRGDTLVDAALQGGALIPTDCGSGQCGTCRVRVLEGSVDDGGTREGDTVLACLARTTDDATIAFDQAPTPATTTGQVRVIRPLSPEIDEVLITVRRPFDWLAGQYVRLRFEGYPARDYSPTWHADARRPEGELLFHIRRMPGGRVSSAIGRGIGTGHRVEVSGPHGSAFLRAGAGRLVLVSGGTGWAPVWAIAAAARQQDARRPLVVVAGARAVDGLYMRSSLDWLVRSGHAEVCRSCSSLAQDQPDGLRAGRPTAHLPPLRDTDTVHAAGGPALVDAMRQRARQAGACFHGDPFVDHGESSPPPRSLAQRLRDWWKRPGGHVVDPLADDEPARVSPD